MNAIRWEYGDINEKQADLGINYYLWDSYCYLFDDYDDFGNSEERLKIVNNFLLTKKQKSKEKCAIELIKITGGFIQNSPFISI